MKLDFENVVADVINVVPPQRAGAIARRLAAKRWECAVRWERHADA